MFRLLKIINNRLEGYLFFYRNIVFFRKFESVQTSKSQGLILRGADISDFERIDEIYKELNGVGLSPLNRRVLQCSSKKLIIVLEEELKDRSQIVGISLFYMNARDFKEKTIHEGFIGVIPEHEGRGLATRMRRYAIAHFSRAGFKGISTRISKRNLGSLRSAEKLGFQPVEEYFDPSMSEDRYYLIFRFENACDK